MSQHIVPDRLLGLSGQKQNNMNLPDLDTLTRAPGHILKIDMNAAYLISHGAVAFLVKNCATEKILDLIHGFVETQDVKSTFEKNGMNYTEFKTQTLQLLFRGKETGRIQQTRRFL